MLIVVRPWPARQRLVDLALRRGSSALVASSRMRMRGSRSSARAIASRCRWPPLMRTPRSPSDRVVAGRQRSDGALEPGGGRGGDLRVGRPRRPRAMFSRSVVSNRKVSWKTRPICPRNEAISRSRRSWPSNRTRPSLGSQKRSRRLTTVLFPEPEAPTIATCVPAGMVRLRSRRIGRPARSRSDPLEPDLVRHARQLLGVRRLLDRDRLVQHLQQRSIRARARAGPLADVRERRDRLEERRQQTDEGDQRAQGQWPLITR